MDELSSELSVSTRTIRRDIEAIETAHLPIAKSKTDDGVAIWSIRWAA